MRVGFLKSYLNTLPENMEIYVQTCEGDLISPLEFKHIWQNEAFIDVKYKNLEKGKMIITAFVEGQDTYPKKNKASGILVVNQEDR